MNSYETSRKDVRTIFDCVAPGKGAILAAILADILADGLDTTQINVLATFIIMIGDSLSYIAAQTDLNEQIRNGSQGADAASPVIIR